MTPNETSSRVRKACLPCIRAKAKCATSELHPNECHRCVRLNKQCAFEVVAKKPGPGPKSRSRVRQLEQRVESLIDLITTKNTTPDETPAQIVTPDSTIGTEAAAPEYSELPAPRYWVEQREFKFYDPVEAGAISEEDAYGLVEEFKTSFMEFFPFVVVEGETSELRSSQPFLFHSILTVTAWANPHLQYVLSEELRRQLARIIEHSQKGLGILQGLLVYGAWYHAFYHPATQQLAIIIQLCVAMVQDLGLSRNGKLKVGTPHMTECGVVNSRPTGCLAEQRAYLGTFFLSVLFAQAWRKPTTLTYTRRMTQCCDAFSSSPVPTDALIRPFVQASELLSRVNTYYSYEDLDNAEVRGEMILQTSVNSFQRELLHMKRTASSPPQLIQHTALDLMYLLIEIGINEVCLHSSLWHTSPEHSTLPLSLIRLKMLHGTMQAATSYLITLSQAPQTQLYQLGLGSWAGWFYVVIVVCKLVFLLENERLGCTELENVPEGIDSMNLDNAALHSNPVGLEGVTADSDWDALAVSREYNVRGLFEQIVEKLRCTLPADSAPWKKARAERDSLYSVACIQRVMLNGFNKRLNQQLTAQPVGHDTSNTWQATQTAQEHLAAHQSNILNLPFSNFMNFDALNFDGIDLPTSNFPPQAAQEVLGDWMWNMAMDDFTMPSM